MVTESDMQAELKAILRSIGIVVRHAWERYDGTGSSSYLNILTDLNTATAAIGRNIKE